MKSIRHSFIVLGWTLIMISAPAVIWAEDAMVGMDWVNAPYDRPLAEQEATLTTMERAGIHFIRASIPNSVKGLDFAQRVYAHGIKIVWIVGLSPSPGTPWPHAPAGFGGLWQGYPLSKMDAEQFRAYFQPLLAKLEDRKIVIAAFELGNEVNWAGFNADFSLPGEGRVLGAGDLVNDPEGKRVANGFLQYLKTLAALKDIRDHSRLNQHTPIISAGLADMGDSDWTRKRRADAVGVAATLDFLRENGLDQLVDGYGIHSYPPSGNPGTSEGAAARRKHVQENGSAECEPAGSANGKPCWFTEWGVGGASSSCPVDDTTRLSLVREMREYYRQLVRQGRLKGLIFYQWEGSAHAAKEDPASAFRCGSLTQSGRLAVSPF